MAQDEFGVGRIQRQGDRQLLVAASFRFFIFEVLSLKLDQVNAAWFPPGSRPLRRVICNGL